MKCILLILGVWLLGTIGGRAGEGAPPTNTPPPQVTLQDFKLAADLTGERASFLLTATAVVEDRAGGSLELLNGVVALTEVGPHPKWQLRAEQGSYVATFPKRGRYAVTLKFDAAVQMSNGWRQVAFRVAPGAVQPLHLRGVGAEATLEIEGAARPEWRGGEHVSFLPADGRVKLSWKDAHKEDEGKLFYTANLRAQISVRPGLLTQVALVDFKVTQGELQRVSFLLQGSGEVTRVAGEHVLAWNVEPGTNATERRLIVQLNQAQKDAFALQVQWQTPLDAFPQTTEVMRLQPEGATRFAGHLRVVNDGAVRLEATETTGLAQLSPEQFPEDDASRAAFAVTGIQRFVYRFASADYHLRVQADQMLPELTVSEVLAYHHGQNELMIEAELELEVREAPLRELSLRVPSGYALARLTASGMNDYFLREGPEEGQAELRIVYGQPVSGRQLVQLRLERNQALLSTNWSLPRIEVNQAKAVRGNVGVSSDAGFRLTVQRTQALTEMATAFFPKKTANLQAAFRLNEAAWQAVMQVERLPQTITADGFHLFSVAEGVAYGSSILNYLISGAPVSTLRVAVADEYFNVEFTGKDVRNWQKTTNGYVVQLQAPVSGAYTLLATYERPFKAQGETLNFTGAHALDAPTESGHTLVISAYQFQVKPVEVSPGLLPLETGEVPAEYRLFFDAPLLAAYRYAARPFNLRLALSPLAQGESLHQVVDRAALRTRLSREGQVLTEATYFVKSRGSPNFRIALPPGMELWQASVNGAAVVPVRDGNAHLIPLPARAEPQGVLKLELKLAAKATNATRVMIRAPVVDAPVMLAEWKLEPDAGQRLVYRHGSVAPVAGLVDRSGFAQVSRAFTDGDVGGAWKKAGLIVALLLATLVLLRWAGRQGGYKFSPRFLLAMSLSLLALGLAAFCSLELAGQISEAAATETADLSFLSPIQQAGSSLEVEVENLPLEGAFSWIGTTWPVGVALVLFAFAWLRPDGILREGCRWLAWMLLGWAALRALNGGVWFLGVVALFLMVQVLWPAVRWCWQLPRQQAASPGPLPAAAQILLCGFLMFGSARAVSATEPLANANENEGRAESVSQQISATPEFVTGKVTVRWTATKGQTLPLLAEPGVLTRAPQLAKTFKLVQTVRDGKRIQQLVAERNGEATLEYEYQIPFATQEATPSFELPTPFGLVNRCTLQVEGRDVDIVSPQAVAILRRVEGSNTIAQVLFAPAARATLGWRPRSRDVTAEKAVFYAELTQLYVPSAGSIEGAHLVTIRPAQGELKELTLTVPAGMTITDVLERNGLPDTHRLATTVAAWRFDPDAHQLRVTLNPAQSRQFTFVVRSQTSAGTLPFKQPVGVLSVAHAARQMGMVGVATGNDVQLEAAEGAQLSPVNLEDFPADTMSALASQTPGLTVRRAYRYAETNATLTLQAAAVEPDVRVEMQQTLSLGEDRTILAGNATVDVARSGIFRLSFVLPSGFDVETISGAALSHWTELKTETNRVVTLHLRGKTEGRQQFSINLAGAGVKAMAAWNVPRLILREAGKQQGTLLIVPEQGMQLQPGALEGLSQVDPQRVGVRQKGVLAFRILQPAWQLALKLEQVAAWVQVTSLQHTVINPSQMKVTANLQYQIENSGVKTFRVWLPTNAESVRFSGEQVADFLALPEAGTNGSRLWEVRLQRRVIGALLLQAQYQLPLAETDEEITLRGVQAADVNLQRGFVTVQAGGRLQVRPVETVQTALQPTEWQSIPRALQQNLETAAANLAYRLVEPGFGLRLRVERHEAAKLLAARVSSVTLTSVLAEDGAMLTQVRLELQPGDKRLLGVRLPAGAKFWFAFVNQNGVWPWREQDRLLIPLAPQSRADQVTPVEIFYSCPAGKPGTGGQDFDLLAPQFDLPLEGITWRVHLNDRWQVQKWNGTLSLAAQTMTPLPAVLDLARYLETESGLERDKTQQAEQMLALGNEALRQGSPWQARRAFQSAYGLSTHDNAFNEDARVQLHNLKLQQALVGLNVRHDATLGEAPATGLGGRWRGLRGDKELNYTQQDARQIIDRNAADDNAATMRLAEKLIQQQDAAVTGTSAIRANIPEQGQTLTFERAVAVERDADLRIHLKIKPTKNQAGRNRWMVLMIGAAVCGGLVWLSRRLRGGETWSVS